MKVNIRQMNSKLLPPDTHWVSVFYGPWNVDEIELVEKSCFNMIKSLPKVNDEWRFFKGRNLYTAWRYLWVSGKIVSEPTLEDLVDEVEKACHKIHL